MNDPSETPESLRQRWLSGTWKNALDAIFAEAAQTTRRISAGFLRSLNLPDFDGRLDLRGINFFVPLDPLIHGNDKSPLRLHGINFRDIDFSHAVMRFSAGETKLSNVLFCGAILEDFNTWDCVISTCDFSHAFMPWFSASRGTIFTNSKFDYTRIRHHASIHGYARFESCSFLKLDWRMIHFRGCCFSNCRFTGHLQKSYAQKTSSQGFAVFRDYLKKREYSGYNVFVNCSFGNLTVTRFSVQVSALTLKHCVEFPTSTLPSKEGRTYLDYYSNNVKPQ